MTAEAEEFCRGSFAGTAQNMRRTVTPVERYLFFFADADVLFFVREGFGTTAAPNRRRGFFFVQFFIGGS